MTPPEREGYVGGGLKKIIEFGAKVVKPLNKNQKKTKKATEAQAVTAKAQTRAVVGTTVTLGIGDLIYSNVFENKVPSLMQKAEAADIPFRVVEERINPEEYPVYKKNSDSAKAFRQAQRDAKQAGADFFEYEGRSYNTTEVRKGKAKGSTVTDEDIMRQEFLAETTQQSKDEDDIRDMERQKVRNKSKKEQEALAKKREEQSLLEEKRRLNSEAAEKYFDKLGLAKGGLPDLTGDGKITQADVLKGRGVFNEGSVVEESLLADKKAFRLEQRNKFVEQGKSLRASERFAQTLADRKFGSDYSLMNPEEQAAMQEKSNKARSMVGKAEGSLMMPQEGMPVDTYDNIPPEEMEEAMASQLPDDEMEDSYTSYVMDESLDDEEQEYLAGVLESDPRLSDILDKVITVASEFSGQGEVAGPGTGVSDSIPARLSDGEFVMTKKATDQLGADNLQVMMDDAERAYDGGYQMKAMGGVMDEEDPADPMMSKTKEEIEKLMMGANRMPSLQ